MPLPEQGASNNILSKIELNESLISCGSIHVTMTLAKPILSMFLANSLALEREISLAIIKSLGCFIAYVIVLPPGAAHMSKTKFVLSFFENWFGTKALDGSNR